jgi:hypothetical protein
VVRIVWRQAEEIPIRRILRQTSGTVVMNVLSWNRAHCLFPRTTLEERRIYAFREQEAVSRYVRRGWDVCSREGRPAREVLEGRRVGDGLTWSIPLDTEWVEEEDVEFQLSEYAPGLLTGTPPLIQLSCLHRGFLGGEAPLSCAKRDSRLQILTEAVLGSTGGRVPEKAQRPDR